MSRLTLNESKKLSLYSRNSPTSMKLGTGLQQTLTHKPMVHEDAVNLGCDDPNIKAISFVGSNTANEYIHARGSANDKRLQANLGEQRTMV